MSQSTDRLRARFTRLPPLMRWAVAAMGIIVLFVFLDDYSWSLAREWNDEASDLAQLLEEGNQLSAPLNRSTEAAVRAFGRVDVPSTEAEGSQAMAQAINEIIKRHRVGNFSYEAHAGSRMQATAMVGVAQAGTRLERTDGELSFDAAPDEANQIISEIESSAAIDAIGSIRLDWTEAQKKVGVRMTVEAWVVAPRTTRRRS